MRSTRSHAAHPRGRSRAPWPVALLLATTACAGLGRGAPSAGTEGDWAAHDGSLAGERFSRLAEIGPGNVSRLRPVCTFETGDPGAFQAGPVAVGGVLYVTTDTLTLALDGATCAVRWRHERARPPGAAAAGNHGVAWHDGRLFRTYGDGHVLAIDADAGRTLWDVAVADPKAGETLTAAPLAWAGMVFVGNGAGDAYGVTGHVNALSAVDGHLLWRLDVVPPAGPVRETWTSGELPPAGGGVGSTFSLDAAAGLLYVATGGAAPAFLPELRPGPSLYASAILAVEARTGFVAGYAQPIPPGDAHHHAVAAAPALVTTRGGTPLALAAGGDGLLHGIDRGGVHREAAVAADRGIAPASLVVRWRTPTTTREGLDAPLSRERLARFCPGVRGGTAWNGPAFDPGRNTVIAGAVDWCTAVTLADPAALGRTPGGPFTGAADPGEPLGQQDPADRWGGWLSAFDADTGALRWKHRSPTPLLAGVTATATGLVFTADLDGNVLALETATGKELWRGHAGQPVGAGVVTYAAGGHQLVAVAAGPLPGAWPVKAGGSRVVVFGLPGGVERKLPLYIGAR